MRNRTIAPGLQKKGQIWHVDKKIRGYGRLCESTGTSDYAEAEQYLARRLEEIRQATVYGVRPERTFNEAAEHYIGYKADKRSIRQDAIRLNRLSRFIGELPLHKVHMGVLQPYIEDCRQRGLKTASINHGLKVVRQILNLAAGEWVDEHGLTWLDRPPKIKLLPVKDARQPRTISWTEEKRFLAALPTHLQSMALFALNTGLREGELCGLRWEWEADVRGLDSVTVFILPPEAHKAGHKSGMERLVVLNRVAQSVVEAQRGKHETHVFAFRGKPIQRLVNSGWDKARAVSGIDITPHSLRHTFGQRLRAAGVNFRDSQDLLGHKNQNVTAHYTKAEIANLLDAANAIIIQDERKPELTLVRRRRVA